MISRRKEIRRRRQIYRKGKINHNNNIRNNSNFQNQVVLLNILLLGIHLTKVPAKCYHLPIESYLRKVNKMMLRYFTKRKVVKIVQLRTVIETACRNKILDGHPRHLEKRLILGF